VGVVGDQCPCGSLLDAIAITDSWVFDHVGVVPDFGDYGGGVGGHGLTKKMHTKISACLI